MKCLFVLALVFGLPFSARSEPPMKADGFTYSRSVGGIDEYKLDANGLRVLLLPQKLAPVVTFMVTYHVGSRNEVTGTTGATHLLEHLMFKGTTTHDRSLGTGYDQALVRVGAETNATTWLDRTNYFATVPANALPLLIEVESDRMRNLALREEDRRPEMTVVRNEFERGENKPDDALSKEVWAASFLAHPYHHDTIGWRSDIERVPIEKLRAFYDTFYWPNNATVTVIGDFDPAATLALIKQSYGAIPKSPHPFPEIYTTEPEQTGPRRVIMRRAGELGVVSIAHKIPQATAADWPALDVLGAVLSSGKTSRCYRALTDKNLTIEVRAGPGFNHDPSLHVTVATLNSGVKHEDVEHQLLAEFEKVKQSGITPAELETALAGLLAKRAFARDGSFMLASEINECIAAGDWTLYITLADKLKAVTAADVQRVAKKYLVEKHSVTGWFVPTDGTGDDAAAEGDAVAAQEKFEPKKVLAPKAPDRELGPLPLANLAARVQRSTVAGLDVLICPSGVKDVAHLRMSLSAGDAASANPALARITAEMLARGTKKHDQFALAGLLEKVGATIEPEVKTDTLEFNVKCLAKNVPLVISVLAEELRSPIFPAEELAKVKKDLAGVWQQSLEDTDMQAAIEFARAVFPKNHPACRATVKEFLAALEMTTLADVRAFHAANYGPAGAHLVAVGDVDPAALQAEIAKAFAGWKEQPKREAAKADTVAFAGGDFLFPMQDKSSVSVMIGQPSGLRMSDPDWLALSVGTRVLGDGFISRLMGNVRDREGLTYGISSGTDEDIFRGGSWFVMGTFAPALLDKGLASTRREIDHWWKDGITADELAYRKSAASGSFTVGLETTEGLAKQLMLCAELGLEVKWLDEYPARVQALTLDQVTGAMKKYLDPAKMATVKAGTVAK